MWHVEYQSAITGKWYLSSTHYPTLWLALAVSIDMVTDGIAISAYPTCYPT